MRGADVTQEGLFIVKKTADYVPADHPLIAIREIVNTALREMDRLFESMYEERGRYSVPPEWLLRGLIVQALYGIRSERLLCEQLGYNMLFRWFVGLGMEDGAWDHSIYTQNRDRLIDHDAIRTLFGKVMQQAEEANLLSSEHFSVDGTLIRAWASIKSFVPKDGPPPDKSGSKSNPEVDFKGQKRSNATHVSTSDPDSQLFTKSKKAEALPSFMGHVLMDNRSGLAVDTRLTPANGKAECHAALDMLPALPGRSARRWAPTKPSIPRSSSAAVARSTSRPMSRKTPTNTTPRPVSGPRAKVASTRAPLATQAIRSAKSYAS